jgi:DNA-nicking Smr family endonuclease
VDFGDILDQWERGGNGGGGGQGHGPGPNTQKKAPALTVPATPAPQKKVNPIDQWLRINGVYDKDAEMEDAGRSGAEQRRLLREKRPDAVIDIHGLTRDEAWDALERFVGESRGRGLQKLLIIHGKGNHSRGEAVLKRSVREFIERCPFAGDSGHEKTGGSGATWVLLKDPRAK